MIISLVSLTGCNTCTNYDIYAQSGEFLTSCKYYDNDKWGGYYIFYGCNDNKSYKHNEIYVQRVNRMCE